jgi:4-diphosphocytidyl-2C-methyl-D-erythritol kinase
MYSRIFPEHYTSGGITDEVIALLTRGEQVRHCSLFNVFDKAADSAFPGLKAVRGEFQEVAGKQVQLAGAGPALYALFNDYVEAAGVHRTLQEKGYETYMAETRSSIEL